MKRFALILFTVVLAALTLPATAAEAGRKKDKAEKAEKAKGENAKTGKLHHVVAFKFKATATKEQIKQVEEAFAALKTKIPQIDKLKWGTNVSPEKHDKGFTHSWVLTFASEKARDEYLVHPDHKEFGKLVGPAIDDVFVIDFWAQK
jgi:hypothetical protein